MNDTDDAARRRYLALIGGLSKPERMRRMVELSAFARTIAWEGARRDAGSAGTDAVRDRFLTKLYGPAFAARARQLLANP